jgi:hypothetical protein
MLNQTVLHEKGIMRFVITNIEVALFDHPVLTHFPDSPELGTLCELKS